MYEVIISVGEMKQTGIYFLDCEQMLMNLNCVKRSYPLITAIVKWKDAYKVKLNDVTNNVFFIDFIIVFPIIIAI